MIALRDIPRNNYIKLQTHNAIMIFLAWFIVDRWVIQNEHKLLYTDIDLKTKDIFRVLDDKLFKKYKHNDYRELLFTFDKWLLNEFFWWKGFKLKLPIQTEWKEVSETIMKYYMPKLTKGQAIDDLQYIIFRAIIKSLWVYYDETTWRIWFWNKLKQSYILIWKQNVKWKIVDFNLEEVLAAEVLQWYINKIVWDPAREYAYTHLLREHAEFRLTWWAKQVLIEWKKYNILATSRWQGKTFLAAFVAARWLLDERPWFWWRKYREIKYFVPDKENIWNQVMEYIKSLLWTLAFVKLENWKKAFEIWQYHVKCNITWNIFKIVSLYNFWLWNKELWSSLWEWIACDLAIIDEAARIADNFWISFHQRAAFETQEFFICTTINEETPVDHWFYKLLVDWETWDDNISSYRIGIDDNEIMRYWKTDAEWMWQLEKVKEELRKKWDKEFYAKWYCIILEESNVFQLWWVIVPSMDNEYNDSDPRILWFDLWKLDDTAGLTIINLKHRVIESSIIVNNLTYWMQLEYAKEYKKKFTNLLVIWDRSWVWEAVSEQDLTWVVDVWIKSTGTWELNFNKKYKFYTCNKWFIITTFASVLAQGIIKIPNNNTDLIDQMNNFIKMKSWRWEVILYKWKWRKKDDLVLSSAYAILYMFSILWLKTIEDINYYINEIWNNQTYLYNEVSVNNWSYYWWLY